MVCDYCNPDIELPLIETATKLSKKGDFYPGITVGVYNDELWVVAEADTYEPGCLEADVKIKFCPMCGRKLEEKYEPNKSI